MHRLALSKESYFSIICFFYEVYFLFFFFFVFKKKKHDVSPCVFFFFGNISLMWLQCLYGDVDFASRTQSEKLKVVICTKASTSWSHTKFLSIA